MITRERYGRKPFLALGQMNEHLRGKKASRMLVIVLKYLKRCKRGYKMMGLTYEAVKRLESRYRDGDDQ